MKDRETEIVRRSTLIASRNLAERLKSKNKFENFEEHLDAYMAILETEFPGSENLRIQAFNTYLLGFYEGALAARNMDLGRIRGNRKKLQRLIETLKQADFSDFSDEFE